MNIDHYLELAQNQKKDPSQEIVISKEWAQGRTVYGGLSASMLLAAGKAYVNIGRQLRSMSTNFTGPLFSQVPFTITVEVVRSGKNVSQIQARIIQNEKVCVVSQFCFAIGRPSKIVVENFEQHELPLPEKAKFIPQIPKVTPKFLKHFDLSIQDGGLPFLGSSKNHYNGWMKYKKTLKKVTDAHIIGLIDVWPPTVIQMLKWPAPTSTVSWNVEFIYPHNEVEGSDWFAYKAQTRQASNGYAHTEATVWDSHGNAIALSRQTVAVFD